jgi:hypothetical protein
MSALGCKADIRKPSKTKKSSNHRGDSNLAKMVLWFDGQQRLLFLPFWKRVAFSFNGGSDRLAAQEGRNIENGLLGRIVHRGRPAVRIETLRSRLVRIF